MNPCTVRSDATSSASNFDEHCCRFPARYLEVTRLRSAPRSSTATLNGFGIHDA